MNDITGLTVEPNYPGLAMTLLFMGVGTFIIVTVFFILSTGDYVSSFVDWGCWRSLP